MTAPFAIIHVPHASTAIPEAIRPTICLADDELRHELLIMTDWHTDTLFALPNDAATTMLFPVSRLVVDPERFVDDEREPMAGKGMGVIYTRTSGGRNLRHELPTDERDRLLNTYYYPHQQHVQDVVTDALAMHGKCLLIDAHSFSSKPLPHEPDQSPNRCDICIGTDDFHTPPGLVGLLRTGFEKRGFVVAVNQPFSGAFVPTCFYRENCQVSSVMIEVNRSLYIDEATGRRHARFDQFQSQLRQVLMEVVAL
jgi:N-formylglutamate amidohydrolase